MPRPEDLLRMAGVGRFQVMALLQAARYYVLEHDLDKAKSFGLNRAIFYAWAKHYGPRYRRYSVSLEQLLRRASQRRPGEQCPEGMREVLGECVQVSRRGWFMIGGEEQTPRDFDREVASRISRVIDWDRAWRAAVEYVSRFPEWVLRDPQRFYRLVYEPVRDTFFPRLLRGEKPEPPRHIAERLEALRKAEEKTRQLGLDTFIEKKDQKSRES